MAAVKLRSVHYQNDPAVGQLTLADVGSIEQTKTTTTLTPADALPVHNGGATTGGRPAAGPLCRRKNAILPNLERPTLQPMTRAQLS